MNNSLIVSSGPRNGTQLVSAVILNLFKYTNFQRKFNLITNSLISVFGDYSPQVSKTNVGILSILNQEEIHMRAAIFDNNNVISGIRNMPLDASIFYDAMKAEPTFFLTHSSPGDIADNAHASKINKKVFVCRDFRDVYNSMTKYISGETRSYNLIKSLKDPDLFQKFNYLDSEWFYEQLSDWKKQYLVTLRIKNNSI